MSWQHVLQSAVNTTSRADVARKLGVSRTSISLLLLNKYPGSTAKMARRINTILTPEQAHSCPHTGEDIAITACAKISAHMPTSGPAALRHWKTCQTCGLNPHKKEQ